MTLPHRTTINTRTHYIITNGKHVLDKTGTAWLPSGTSHQIKIFDTYDEAYEFILTANESGERYFSGQVQEIKHGT